MSKSKGLKSTSLAKKFLKEVNDKDLKLGEIIGALGIVCVDISKKTGSEISTVLVDIQESIEGKSNG